MKGELQWAIASTCLSRISGMIRRTGELAEREIGDF